MLTANSDWAAVSSSSMRCWASIGRPSKVPAEIAKTIGIVPTSSVHWLTLLDSSVPSESDALSRHANRQATISSGASLASGATHCTRMNGSTPRLSPVCTRPSAKCSAQARMTAAAKTNSACRPLPPRGRQPADPRRRAAGPAPPRAPRQPPRVGDEDRHEDGGVDEGEDGRSGRVSEYRVAIPRKTTSAEIVRGIWTRPVVLVARRSRRCAASARPRTPRPPRPAATRRRPAPGSPRSCSPAPARRRWSALVRGARSPASA